MAETVDQEQSQSLMVEWLEQASQWYKMNCYDLEFMSSNPGQIKIGLRCRPTFV